MNIKEQVKVWYKAGAIYKDGVLLFKKIFGDDHPFVLLLQNETAVKRKVLSYALRSYVKRNFTESSPAPDQPEHKTPAGGKPKIKLREDFAFLSDPDCPNELKILAANKITAFYNCVEGHKQLFSCGNTLEQFNAAKFLTENYIENNLILKELEYYKKNKSFLAEHPIFKNLKRLRELNKMTVIDLIKLREKLRQNIWRAKDEIKKKDKPHLTVERERAIANKEFEITEITRLLAKYE